MSLMAAHSRHVIDKSANSFLFPHCLSLLVLARDIIRHARTAAAHCKRTRICLAHFSNRSRYDIISMFQG